MPATGTALKHNGQSVNHEIFKIKCEGNDIFDGILTETKKKKRHTVLTEVKS